MKFIPAENDKIIMKRCHSDNYAFLREFDNSGLECAEIVNYPHKDAKSCSGSISATIRRYKMNHIKCHIYNGKIYLVKWEDFNKKSN